MATAGGAGGSIFFFQRRAEDKPVGGEIIFLGDVGQQIVADVQLRMNMQIDKPGTNDFTGGIDDPVRWL